MADLRPPPLGMIATGSFDVDYRRDLTEAPMSMPGRYPSPPRRYTASPLGSERSGRSDRSDNHYDDRYRYVDVWFGFGQSILRLSVVDLMQIVKTGRYHRCTAADTALETRTVVVRGRLVAVAIRRQIDLAVTLRYLHPSILITEQVKYCLDGSGLIIKVTLCRFC